jgi:sulfatase modifying factor 1
MSAFVGTYRDEMDASYAADFGRDREPMKTRSRRPEYRRKGSAPARVNGIHCRRNKRWTWGSGRGARVTNLRAFAGCLAAAFAAVAGSVQASPLVPLSMIPQFVQISGSNAAQSSGPNAGLGSVSNTYWMSKTETTVAQYAAFLNSQAKSDPFSLYNSQMSTIGLTQTGSSGSFTYTASGSTANRPIAFVDYMAAVRFANWATTGTMNAGAYTITGSTSAFRSGNGFVLPTANEWYKAAFYNPTLNSGSGGYTAWQTVSGSTPVAATPPGGPLSANWNNVVLSGTTPVTTNVGAYTSNTSAYGMYDMLGNVAEWSETVTSGSARVFSGGYTITGITNWGADGVQTRLMTIENQSIGFRLASTVQPVPEPGTIALAATGAVGIGGAGWLKRRRRKGLAAPATGPLA